MNLWIKLTDATHQIVSYNKHVEGKMYQLWATRPNGKSFKLIESKYESDVDDYKNMIDFAVEHNETIVEIG
jgi:Tfp pilus assembly major pilin PilA